MTLGVVQPDHSAFDFLETEIGTTAPRYGGFLPARLSSSILLLPGMVFWTPSRSAVRSILIASSPVRGKRERILPIPNRLERSTHRHAALIVDKMLDGNGRRT